MGTAVRPKMETENRYRRCANLRIRLHLFEAVPGSRACAHRWARQGPSKRMECMNGKPKDLRTAATVYTTIGPPPCLKGTLGCDLFSNLWCQCVQTCSCQWLSGEETALRFKRDNRSVGELKRIPTALGPSPSFTVLSVRGTNSGMQNSIR